MPRHANRFIIKHPTVGYFADCEIVGTRKVIETDANGNDSVHNRHVLKPRFDTIQQASIFGDEPSAKMMMEHAFLQDPKAFEGCTLEVHPDDQ